MKQEDMIYYAKNAAKYKKRKQMHRMQPSLQTKDGVYPLRSLGHDI